MERARTRAPQVSSQECSPVVSVGPTHRIKTLTLVEWLILFGSHCSPISNDLGVEFPTETKSHSDALLPVCTKTKNPILLLHGISVVVTNETGGPDAIGYRLETIDCTSRCFGKAYPKLSVLYHNCQDDKRAHLMKY